MSISTLCRITASFAPSSTVFISGRLTAGALPCCQWADAAGGCPRPYHGEAGHDEPRGRGGSRCEEVDAAGCHRPDSADHDDSRWGADAAGCPCHQEFSPHHSLVSLYAFSQLDMAGKVETRKTCKCKSKKMAMGDDNDANGANDDAADRG